MMNRKSVFGFTYGQGLMVGAALAVLILAASSAQAWDSDLDATFSYDGKIAFAMHSGTSVATAVAVQPDGKIVVAGYSHNGSNYDFAVVRINNDGNFDYTFDGDGRAFFNFGWGDDLAGDVVVQPDGKIVLVGVALIDGLQTMAVVRLNADGSLDGYTIAPYGVDAYGHGVALQSDGKIVVAGKAYYANTGADFAVARFNSDLSPDTSFASDGSADWDFGEEGYDCAYEVAVRGDGRIVIAGTALWSDQSVFGIMVYSTTGGPLSLGFASFDDHAYGYGLALQEDGKAVVSGRCLTHGGDFAVARFQTNCLLDTTFSGDGKVTFSHSAVDEESALDVAVQHDGKIIVAGYVTDGGIRKFALLRYLSNGNWDGTFSDSPLLAYTFIDFFTGYDSQANAICLQPDGKMVVAGSTDYSDGQPAAVARFMGVEDLIFADGFESGSTLMWSSW